MSSDASAYPRRMRQYFIACMGFGALMGIVFPPFAYLFVEQPEGLARWLFQIACILAGLAVGVIANILGRKLMLEFIRKPISEIQELFKSSQGRDSGDNRHIDPLVGMRMDLEDTIDYIIDSARLAREAEAQMLMFNERFGPTLERIEEGARINHRLANQTDHDLSDYEKEISRVIEAFEVQDGITDAVQNGIAAVTSVLGDLAREIRDASSENEKTASEILAESDRFLGALSTLSEAAGLIGDVGRDIRQLAETVSGTSGDIREIGDISARTQVLAINANVEAARAGDETGRGFRVIAGTVSELADRSGTVSGEILSSLEILEDKSRSIAVMADERESSLNAYRNQAGQAQAARVKIAQDLERSLRTDERVLRALNAQEEQMRSLLETADEMNRNENVLMENIGNLKQGFHDLSGRGGEMMSISREQEEAASEIRSIYSELSRLTAGTSRLAKRFKVMD